MHVVIRADKSPAGKRRELGVVFDNLRVIGAGASANYQPTLAMMFSPFHWLEKLQSRRHPALRDILAGFYGVVRPGEMCCASQVLR